MMNMEKCDIFSLGMILLKTLCGLSEDQMELSKINVIETNTSEVL